MLRFYAEAFVQAMGALSRMSMGVSVMADVKASISDDLHKTIEEVLAPLDDQITKLPFSYSLRLQYARFKRVVETSRDAKELSILGDELIQNMIAELTAKVFLMISEENAELYGQPEPPFGLEVAQRFSEANYDIEAGTRCLALDEWTASVFHMMRVLEKGLHWLATKIGVSMTPEIDLINWKNIIDQIEKQIRDLEKEPKSRAKSKKMQFYCQAATNFFYFKDAWRNHVSHSRTTYDERQAKEVWNHVRSFMQRLAAEPS
jgi:hypothetical protein